MKKKVIAFSIWGSNLDYTVGAVKNQKLAEELYPGWHSVFYIHPNVDKSIIEQLRGRKDSSVLLLDDKPISSDLMFLRLLPLLADDVDVLICRDSDSRLNTKEAFAVDEWLSSQKQFHCMRDHDFHSFPPVLGGMCGFKLNGSVNPKWIHTHINRFRSGNYGDDQRGLQDLYTAFPSKFLEHDDSRRFNGVPFPFKGEFKYGSFIGQRITWKDKEGRL